MADLCGGVLTALVGTRQTVPAAMPKLLSCGQRGQLGFAGGVAVQVIREQSAFSSPSSLSFIAVGLKPKTEEYGARMNGASEGGGRRRAAGGAAAGL